MSDDSMLLLLEDQEPVINPKNISAHSSPLSAYLFAILF
jgi:hypothetical protein